MVGGFSRGESILCIVSTPAFRYNFVNQILCALMQRRQFITTFATASTIAVTGCSSSESEPTDDGNESEINQGTPSTEQTDAESVVEDYYTAGVNGDLTQAASVLLYTQVSESGEGGSVDQIVERLRNQGMSESGTDASLGEFNELSVSEFANFTFLNENGQEQQFTEQEVANLLPTADAFGGDAEPTSLVHHTGGFQSDIWLPSQPTEEPDAGWGEVVVEVGPFDGDLFIIGDFRTYTSYKIVE